MIVLPQETYIYGKAMVEIIRNIPVFLKSRGTEATDVHFSKQCEKLVKINRLFKKMYRKIESY